MYMTAKQKHKRDMEAKFSSNFWKWVETFERNNKCIVKVNIEDLDICENPNVIQILGKKRTYNMRVK